MLRRGFGDGGNVGLLMRSFRGTSTYQKSGLLYWEIPTTPLEDIRSAFLLFSYLITTLAS